MVAVRRRKRRSRKRRKTSRIREKNKKNRQREITEQHWESLQDKIKTESKCGDNEITTCAEFPEQRTADERQI